LWRDASSTAPSPAAPPATCGACKREHAGSTREVRGDMRSGGSWQLGLKGMPQAEPGVAGCRSAGGRVNVPRLSVAAKRTSFRGCATAVGWWQRPPERRPAGRAPRPCPAGQSRWARRRPLPPPLAGLTPWPARMRMSQACRETQYARLGTLSWTASVLACPAPEAPQHSADQHFTMPHSTL
jgi:hypothetical protein